MSEGQTLGLNCPRSLNENFYVCLKHLVLVSFRATLSKSKDSLFPQCVNVPKCQASS